MINGQSEEEEDNKSIIGASTSRESFKTKLDSQWHVTSGSLANCKQMMD